MRARRVSQIVTFAAAITLAVGLALGEDRLGTGLPPFVAAWDPHLRLLPALLAVVALAGAVALAPRLLSARVSPLRFDAAVYALALGLGLAVGAMRLGSDGWTHVFDLGPGGSFEAPNEYLPGLPTLSYGVHVYLDRFAEVVPSQPVNVAGHPPGPLLVMHWLGISTPGGLAALCIVAGTLCAPLAHRIGRTLHDEQSGRIAGLLCAASPLTLLFGVTSYDYVYAACGALAAWLLIDRRTWVAGALALALAAFMSWALLGVGAWATVVVARRDGLRRAALIAASCGAALLAFNGALALGWGYDPIGTLQATEQVYRDSLARVRPYWFWVAGSLVAWGVMLGLPLAALTLRSVIAGHATGLALALVVLVASVGGFTKAETERIWLFCVPLACVAAAPLLARARLPLVLGLLAAQTLVCQILLDTVW